MGAKKRGKLFAPGKAGTGTDIKDQKDQQEVRQPEEREKIKNEHFEKALFNIDLTNGPNRGTG